MRACARSPLLQPRMKYLLQPAALALLSLPLALTHAHIEEVLVEGKTYVPAGVAISASQGTINNSDINARPRLRTGDILELIPGMVVTQHSGTGKSNQMFLRGFNLDHGTDFATFIDGMPVNMRTHGHGQGYTDLNFIIPEAVETIHFSKGAYYADVSDFSGAGSAQMLTANRIEQGLVELTAGADDFYKFLLVDGAENDHGDWVYALEHSRYDGPWTDISEDLKATKALLKRVSEWEGGHLSLSFMAYDASWNSADQIPQRAVDDGLIDPLGSLDTSVGGQSSRYSLSVNWHNDDIDASLYAIRSDLDLWSNFTYFLDDPVNGDQFKQVDARWIFGGRSVYTHDHGDKPADNYLHPIRTRLGIEFRHDVIEEVGLFSSRQRSRTGVTRLDEVDQTSVGLFADANWQLTASVSAQLGARYDYFYFDVEDQVGVNRNGIDLSANSGSDDDGIFSLKGNLVYAFAEGWEGYLSAGQAFHSNDARGTTTRIDPADGSAAEAVDPLVRSTGYEVGLRRSWGGRGNLSVALWSLELDSELLFVGDAGNTEASDGSERFGFEVTAYYRPVDELLIDLEYARTDGYFVDVSPSANEIPGAVDDVLQAGLSYEAGNGFTTAMRLRYFGERPLVEDGSVTSGDSTVVNLRVGYQHDQWAVQADLLNAFDSDDHDIDYFYASRLEGAVAGIEDVHFHIIEPRTLRVALQYLLD